jgi:hypothetical protein
MYHIRRNRADINIEWYINRQSEEDYTGKMTEMKGIIHSIKSLETGKPIRLVADGNLYKLYIKLI